MRAGLRRRWRTPAWPEGTERGERFTAAFGVLYGSGIWLTGGHRASAAMAIAGDLGLAALTLAVFPRLRQSHTAVTRFFGVGLPLLVFYVLYLQSGLVDMAAVHWRDAALAGLQERLLPSVPFVHTTVVREWFVFAYFSYGPMLVVGITALFVPATPARERNACDAVRRICYAFALCYVVALLYPALSPRFLTPALQLRYLGDGVLSRFAAVAQGAMVPGSSFPSAHIAASTVLMWDLWFARRALFWLLVPLGASMTAGTVLYLYHYVPDVVAGILAGVAAVAFDRWLVGARAHQDAVG